MTLYTLKTDNKTMIFILFKYLFLYQKQKINIKSHSPIGLFIYILFIYSSSNAEQKLIKETNPPRGYILET